MIEQMPDKTDNELLAEFARTESESAFSTLVARHVNLVYATAMRFSRNPHHAEEITQAVFIILARRAGSLGREVILSGWLYQTARLTSANFLKGEIRRRRREQEAYMQSTLNETGPENWERIAPFLDEAMGNLAETDRDAVVLRFFQNKSTREVAGVLRLNEAAAHKRVIRALEKLRKLLSKRGVTLTSATIAGLICANSVQAAPPELVNRMAALALGNGPIASASTLMLVKATMKFMTWVKMKTAMLIGAGAIVAATTTAALYEKIWEDPLGRLDQLTTAPATLIIRPSRFSTAYYPGGANVGTADGKFVYTGATLPDLLSLAYHARRERMILPQALPTQRYDLIVTLPDHQDEALQHQLKEQFGLSAHRETRVMDVLLLKIKDEQKLEARRFKDLQTAVKNNGHKANGLLDARTFDLEQAVGRVLEKPVVDASHKSNEDYFAFDYGFINRKSGTCETKLMDIRQTCLEPAGLELVPGRTNIEVLVVRHTSD